MRSVPDNKKRSCSCFAPSLPIRDRTGHPSPSEGCPWTAPGRGPLAQKVVIIDGLFSNLSNRELIREIPECHVKGARQFQLIGLIHHPQYQNDPDIFPNHIVLARMKRGRSGSYVYLADGKSVSASELGRHEGEIEPVSLHGSTGSERKGALERSSVGENAAGLAVNLPNDRRRCLSGSNASCSAFAVTAVG